ncbi:MAG: LytTR family DNA-binding domain-containing protein [Muribaculaceae bacterium]|nr:LytTR family DNA-binding domain-containing protein [Muribaculaceae bacterium]
MKDEPGQHTYRVAVIDDNPAAIDNLRKRLAPYAGFEVTACAASAADGIRKMQENTPDLLFLDFDLPDTDGFEVIRQLRSNPVLENIYVVIYTGYYDRCSSHGNIFVEGEQDYLFKPIDSKEFDITIQRFLFSRRNRTTMGSLHPVNLPPDDNALMVVMTATTSEMRVIRLRDIGYFRHNSRRKAWEVALADNTVIQLKKSTSASDILKYSPKFVQTHQSFIVNLDYVMLIGKKHISLYPPFENDEALVGRTYLKNLQTRFLNL